MNTSLAPTYQHLFGAYWVLWYATSNSYSVIDTAYKTLLDLYLQSDSLETFSSKLTSSDNTTNPEAIAKNILDYLNDCNRLLLSKEQTPITLDTSKHNILKHYLINGKSISIYFDSELVMKTIHPALAHLETTTNNPTETTFNIYLKNEQLHLFKNNELVIQVPKRDYHLLQGKFIMQLLCTIHNKKDTDWIGTFHGSTLTDGNTSILCVGKSGKGKSTLCALLANSGFKLLADDVSPLLSENKNMHYNPSAISIKEGAFRLLKPIVENFEKIPITQFNTTKGLIKYLPCDKPEKDNYSCKAIVLVNYKNQAKTKLEAISIKTLLETLIPDSWLSPNALHAKQFLNWLETLKVYQLTYSDTQSVIAELSTLFKELAKN